MSEETIPDATPLEAVMVTLGCDTKASKPVNMHICRLPGSGLLSFFTEAKSSHSIKTEWAGISGQIVQSEPETDTPHTRWHEVESGTYEEEGVQETDWIFLTNAQKYIYANKAAFWGLLCVTITEGMVYSHSHWWLLLGNTIMFGLRFKIKPTGTLVNAEKTKDWD